MATGTENKPKSLPHKRSLTSMLEEFNRSALQVSGPMQEKMLNFRMRLVAEEFKEYAEANMDLCRSPIEGAPVPLELPEEELRVLQEAMLKELCDCVYVLIGTAVQFEWDFDEAFRRVHESNMSKLASKVEYHEDGKVLKSDTYKPANLEGCL